MKSMKLAFSVNNVTRKHRDYDRVHAHTYIHQQFHKKNLDGKQHHTYTHAQHLHYDCDKTHSPQYTHEHKQICSEHVHGNKTHMLKQRHELRNASRRVKVITTSASPQRVAISDELTQVVLNAVASELSALNGNSIPIGCVNETYKMGMIVAYHSNLDRIDTAQERSYETITDHTPSTRHRFR